MLWWPIFKSQFSRSLPIYAHSPSAQKLSPIAHKLFEVNTVQKIHIQNIFTHRNPIIMLVIQYLGRYYSSQSMRRQRIDGVLSDTPPPYWTEHATRVFIITPDYTQSDRKQSSKYLAMDEWKTDNSCTFTSPSKLFR